MSWKYRHVLQFQKFILFLVTTKNEVVGINLQIIYFYIAIFFLRLRQQIVGNDIWNIEMIFPHLSIAWYFLFSRIANISWLLGSSYLYSLNKVGPKRIMAWPETGDPAIVDS